MPRSNAVEATVTIHAENIGGIEETEVSLTPGVTILTGRNATNRTSFLQAIMAVMGSEDVTLKGDTDAGRVEANLGRETYRRTLRRTGDTVAFGGEPYLDDPMVADLFAFLLESNEARRRVVGEQDLHELIMRPVSTDEIQAEIDRLEGERDEVDEQLEEFESLKDELPELERRRRRLEAEIEENRETLASKESEIEAIDAEVEETREEKQELDSRLEDLRELRSRLEEVRSDIDVQEESLVSLRRERSDLRTEREGLSTPSANDREQLQERISRLRGRKQTLESEVSDLQDVIQFNEELLDGEQTVVSDAVGRSGPSRESVTDQLTAADSVVCWTCGSEVDRQRIESTVEQLRLARQDYTTDIDEVEEELAALRDEKRKREKRRQRCETLERDLADVEDEIERRESRLEELRERRDRLATEIEDAEAAVEALESDHVSDVVDLHKEANQLEFKLGQLESKLEDVTDRINSIEGKLAEEAELTERRDSIQAELEELRSRIDRIEREAVEEFNDRMDEILEMLAYENLARIWIERVQRTVREGRQTVEKNVFELHVVRTTESGTTYEDTIDHLSESEREVTGLMFALAGYLVHELHETVPFMLLDSVEAIDAERLADLVSYFAEYVEYLVVALLPEDAQALPSEYTRVTEI